MCVVCEMCVSACTFTHSAFTDERVPFTPPPPLRIGRPCGTVNLVQAHTHRCTHAHTHSLLHIHPPPTHPPTPHTCTHTPQAQAWWCPRSGSSRRVGPLLTWLTLTWQMELWTRRGVVAVLPFDWLWKNTNTPPEAGRRRGWDKKERQG